jgi:hypothetical protein
MAGRCPRPQEGTSSQDVMPPAAVAKPRMKKKKTVLGGATSRGAPVSTSSAYVAEATIRRPRSTSTGVGVAARCSPSRVGQREAVVAPRLRIPSRTYEPHLARTLIASTPSARGILTNSLPPCAEIVNVIPTPKAAATREARVSAGRQTWTAKQQPQGAPKARTQSCRKILPARFEAPLLTGFLLFPTA